MTTLDRRQLLAIIAAAGALPVTAAQPDLAADVRILRAALALHPGLHRYSSPAEIEARLSALEPAYAGAESLEERYLILSRFLATIRCGHTYCNFFNQSKAVRAALFDRQTRLPFHFEWIEGRMIVVGDPSGVGLSKGTEVISLNGMRSADMLASLIPYARADGHNDAKRVALLGVTGTDAIEFFDVFQGLVYGAPPEGRHRLVVERPGSGRTGVSVSAIGLAERQAQMTRRDYRGTAPVWTWTVRADGVAVLDMPSWALYDSKWDWRGWLSDRLGEAAGSRGVIVDLRGNEGGEDCGDVILARLADRPLVDPGAERLVRFERTPKSLDPFLDTWDDGFRTLGVGARPVPNGFLRLTGDRADDVIQPVGPRLTVPVAALIGPTNSSATFQFAQKARRSGLVRLFGETTGGNQRGINGGCFFFVRLPGSGIEFDLPLIGYFPLGSPPDGGLAPNVAASRRASDPANSRDRAMAAASDWILENPGRRV